MGVSICPFVKMKIVGKCRHLGKKTPPRKQKQINRKCACGNHTPQKKTKNINNKNKCFTECGCGNHTPLIFFHRKGACGNHTLLKSFFNKKSLRQRSITKNYFKKRWRESPLSKCVSGESTRPKGWFMLGGEKKQNHKGGFFQSKECMKVLGSGYWSNHSKNYPTKKKITKMVVFGPEA